MHVYDHGIVSSHVQAWTTAGATGVVAVLAQAGAPTEITWTTVVLGLISLASLWVRGYWKDRESVIRLRYELEKNATLEDRLAVYEPDRNHPHPPAV